MMVERPVAPQPQIQAQAQSAPLTASSPVATATVAAYPPDSLANSISRVPAATPKPTSRWRAEHDLARHQAETERVKVLVDFLARPVSAPGGAEPDPDIVTAYNLAVEAALTCVRRAAQPAPV